MKKLFSALILLMLLLAVSASAEDAYEKVTFGSYEGEPITWHVLTESEGKTLLFAAKPVALRPYHDTDEDITWADCTLRAWLNDEFCQEAFTEEERAKICETELTNPGNVLYGTVGGENTVDRLFLLSEKQADAYFTVCRDELWPYWWWIRTPGGAQNLAAYVFNKCSFHTFGSYVTSPEGGVRPAMWVTLD